uniref:DUF2129 domain-containing protein n=1 Tax=Caenorhabditis tropicalis TaxID=1561998 RepID=A0A1I7TEK6_9PELO
MVSGVQYNIFPLANHEHSNKVASILENKYKNPTSKRVTLNERFGILEKGYVLQADKTSEEKQSSDVFLVVHDRNLVSKHEFIKNYLTKNPVVAVETIVEEDKENAPTEKNTQKRLLLRKRIHIR